MDIFLSLLEQIDLMYIFICNAATYIILQILKSSCKKVKQTTLFKRMISTVIAIALGLLMCLVFKHPSEAVFYGFFIQFISWDYFFKPIIKSIQDKISKKNFIQDGE